MQRENLKYHVISNSFNHQKSITEMLRKLYSYAQSFQILSLFNCTERLIECVPNQTYNISLIYWRSKVENYPCSTFFPHYTSRASLFVIDVILLNHIFDLITVTETKFNLALLINYKILIYIYRYAIYWSISQTCFCFH